MNSMKTEKEHIFGKGWKNHPAWLLLLLLQPVLIGTAMFIGKYWGWGGIVGMVLSISLLHILGYSIYKGSLGLLSGSIIILMIYWIGIFPMLGGI